MKRLKDSGKPCLDELAIPGFTDVSIPCDLPTRHRLPHRAEIKDTKGRWVVITWRYQRDQKA